MLLQHFSHFIWILLKSNHPCCMIISFNMTIFLLIWPFFLRKSHKGEFWNWTEMQLVFGHSFFFIFVKIIFLLQCFHLSLLLITNLLCYILYMYILWQPCENFFSFSYFQYGQEQCSFKGTDKTSEDPCWFLQQHSHTSSAGILCSIV